MFFMNRALGRDLGWFWYDWLFTTESVDGRISAVESARPAARASRCGRTGRCRRR